MKTRTLVLVIAGKPQVVAEALRRLAAIVER